MTQACDLSCRKPDAVHKLECVRSETNIAVMILRSHLDERTIVRDLSRG
jgi:hypothetical protein